MELTTTNFCKTNRCYKEAESANGYCHDCTEEGLKKLLAKLEAEPLSKERQEFGQFLFRDIESLSISEMKRYLELKRILSNSNKL